MGGTGDGGYSDRHRHVGQEESQEDSCRSLRFTTNLSPVEGAPIHEPGAVLSVAHTPVGVFAAVDHDGRIVGTIIERVEMLRRCTGLGVSYEAEVTEQHLGTHTVQVRAASG